MFQDVAKLARIEEVLSRIVGQPCKMRVDWTDDLAESATTAGKTPAAAAMGQQRQMRTELMQIAFVKKAMEVLNAQIIRADDGFGIAAKAKATESEDVPEDE